MYDISLTLSFSSHLTLLPPKPRVHTSLPDEEGAIGVPGDDVAGVGEGDGGDVFGALPVLEDAGALGQHATLIGPEGDVVLATGDDCVAVQWGEVHREHLVR